MTYIPFNRPFMTGREYDCIAEAHQLGQLAGDGQFTARCSAWLKERTDADRALLTHSCTGALEMAAILAELKPGDEVIMPSFTFVSTANAFILRGAKPVFIDIREDTLNLDEQAIEAVITDRTRAIVPVHYAGVSCEMDSILETAERHGLIVIEDAAQGILSTYKGRPLGTLGDLGALSFHETKNVISGEGGALLLRDPSLGDRAEIIREKGTNRKAFFRGEVDKYSWVDVGSSYLPSELIAAFLWPQLEEAATITARRLAIWQTYYDAFEQLEREGRCRRPVVPETCSHNAHMFYLLMNSAEERSEFIAYMKQQEVHCVFHYVPLHSSAYGRNVATTSTPMTNTDRASGQLVRLPLWLGLEPYQARVIDSVLDYFNG